MKHISLIVNALRISNGTYNITSFNYYYHRRYGKIPAPQAWIDYQQSIEAAKRSKQS